MTVAQAFAFAFAQANWNSIVSLLAAYGLSAIVILIVIRKQPDQARGLRSFRDIFGACTITFVALHLVVPVLLFFQALN